MKLYAYITKTVFAAMLFGVLGLWFLQMIFAYLGEMENLDANYNSKDALFYILYRAPYFLVQFMPTGVLLGAVTGLGILAKNSELVVMRAAGISVWRIVSCALFSAVFFVIGMLMLNQLVLPKTNHLAKNYGQNSTLISLQGYWHIKQDDDMRLISYIDYADNHGNARSIKQFWFKNDDLQRFLNAESGKAADAPFLWQLQNVHTLAIDKHAHKAAHTFDKHRMHTLPISDEAVALLVRAPDDLSISELILHKKLLQKSNEYSHIHTLILWQKIAQSFAILALVVLACSFVFGSLRTQSIGARIVTALMVGLLFSYMQDLSGFLALAYNLNAPLMALMPVLLCAAVGAYALYKK